MLECFLECDVAVPGVISAWMAQAEANKDSYES